MYVAEKGHGVCIGRGMAGRVLWRVLGGCVVTMTAWCMSHWVEDKDNHDSSSP